MMQIDPQLEEYAAKRWTVATLLVALGAKLHVHLSLSVIRGTLHQLDLRWGPPRLGMPDKVGPEKAQKQWALVKAVVDAPQVCIQTPRTNVSRALFGQMLFLPKCCAHLIPAEGTWLRLSGQIAANRLYGLIQALLEAVDACSREMSAEHALARAAA